MFQPAGPSAGQCVALCLLLCCALVAPPAIAQNPSPYHIHTTPSSSDGDHTRLEGILARLAGLDPVDAVRLADRAALPLQNQRVLVEVRPAPGKRLADIDLQYMTSRGAVVQKRSNHVLRLWMPTDRLAELAAGTPALGCICRPRLAHTTVTSEGVALAGADNWQLGGFDGSGIKIAVIDGGFVGLATAKAAGEIPPSAIEHDETGSGMEGDSKHGTAVAEAVYDMAPGAQLYLIHIWSNGDLADAVDYCISQGVDIISMSLAWYNFNHVDGVSHTTSTEPYLGTSPITSIETATAAGILPVVAAGNYSRRHYSGYFNDDGTGRHDFGGGDTELTIYASAGQKISGMLNWDAWPTTFEDFDLELYRASDDTLVAYSRGKQRPGGGRWPVPEESLSYTVPSDQSGNYYFVFVKQSASYIPHFEFLCPQRDLLDWPVAVGSISNPADAAVSLTVGAMNRLKWLTGPQESFSSQGPTNEPLIKPDIVGPDYCNSYTWGYWYGTSQATPHVAGAAALVGSRFDAFGSTDIRDYLQTSAVDMGAAGKDNIYGFGRLNIWAIGDLDHDQDVDLADFAVLAGELAESAIPPSNIETDLDGSGDCDLDDLMVFAAAMTGPTN